LTGTEKRTSRKLGIVKREKRVPATAAARGVFMPRRNGGVTGVGG